MSRLEEELKAPNGPKPWRPRPRLLLPPLLALAATESATESEVPDVLV
jgi:hypothetical protein